jgi:hypothetical protein
MRTPFLAFALALSLAAAPPSWLEPFWEAFAPVWAGSATEAGCGFDPSGGCTPAPKPSLDEGCGFDPSGGCSKGS